MENPETNNLSGRTIEDATRDRVREVWQDYIAQGAAPSLSLGQPADVDESSAQRSLDRLPTSALGGLGGATLESDSGAPPPAQGLVGKTLEAGATIDAGGGVAPAAMLAGLTLEDDVPAPSPAAGVPPEGGGALAQTPSTAATGVEGIGVVSTDRRDDFVIEQKLAAGGMGEVFVARQVGLDRMVALKRPRAHLGRSPKKLGAFVREGMVTGDLEHPNIVPIYQNGVDATGQPYYAMKLVKGVEWRFILHPDLAPADRPEVAAAARKRAQGMLLADHLEILMRVCDAVAFAHSRHVLHRDLKPENVLIGDFGEVQVMDWGLAVDHRIDPASEAKAASRASIRGPAGTPDYMAPEMALARNENISVRTDVYLLGAILYELISGRAPHGAGSLEGALMSAATNRITHPRELNPKAPEGLVRIAMKALSTEPDSRQAEVRSFQDEIREHLKHAQSLEIAEKASARLGALQAESMVSSASAASARYVSFAEVVALFREALGLWSENTLASEGLVKGLVAFIESALGGGDLGLASAQIDELQMTTGAGDERVASFRDKWRRLDRARRARQRNLRVAIGTVAALILVIFIGGFFSYNQIRADRDEAARARTEEEKSKELAVEKQKEAEDALVRVEQQKRLAEAARRTAEQKKREADEQRLKAEEARADEQQARAEETKQRKLAESKQRDALRNLALVDIQRARVFSESDGDYLSAARHLLNAIATVDERDSLGPHLMLQQVLLKSPRLLERVALPRTARSCVVATVDGKPRVCCMLEDGSIWAAGVEISQSGVESARYVARWQDAWVVVDDQGALFVDGKPLAMPADFRNAFSIASRGPLLAVGAEDGRVVVVSRRAIGEPPVMDVDAHRGPVLAVAFVPGRELLLTGGSDGKLILWDLATAQRRRVARAHSGFVASLAVSLDGKRAATGGGEGVVRLWRTDDLILLTSLTGHKREVGAIAFHPARPLLFTHSWDGSVRTWDYEDLHNPRVALLHVDNSSDSLALAIAPGSEVLTCLMGPTALDGWDVSDRRETSPATWRRVTLSSERVLAVRDGGLLVGGGDLIREITRDDGPGTSYDCPGAISACPNGKEWYVLRDDGRLWDLLERRTLVEFGSRLKSADASGSAIAALGPDGTVYVLDLTQRPPAVSRGGTVSGAAGVSVCRPDAEPMVAVWTESGQLFAGQPGALKRISLANAEAITWAGWTCGGRRLVARAGGALHLIDPTGRLERKRLAGTRSTTVTCADAGNWTVVASTADGRLLEWNFYEVGWPDGTSAPNLMATGLTGGVRSLTLSEASSTVVCVLDDGTLREYRAASTPGERDLDALRKSTMAHMGAPAAPAEGSSQ